MRPAFLAVLLVSWSTIAHAQSAFEFVTEYVRELGSIESIRANAERESKDPNANAMADCIRNAEKFQLELRSQIADLRSFRLPPQFKNLIPNITSFYDYKIKTWKELSDGCSVMLAGPKPNIDYSKIVAEAPKLNARLEYIDKSLFDASPLVFATLIDQRPDPQNHLSHLIITKAQRDRLVRSIVSYFGKALDQKNQNYTVSAASVLKIYLTEKGYKCSDEPW
jgi:hypothetical protein